MNPAALVKSEDTVDVKPRVKSIPVFADEEQRKTLDAAFVQHQAPSKKETEELSVRTGLTTKWISAWFARQRTKQRNATRVHARRPSKASKVVKQESKEIKLEDHEPIAPIDTQTPPVPVSQQIQMVIPGHPFNHPCSTALLDASAMPLSNPGPASHVTSSSEPQNLHARVAEIAQFKTEYQDPILFPTANDKPFPPSNSPIQVRDEITDIHIGPSHRPYQGPATLERPRTPTSLLLSSSTPSPISTSQSHQYLRNIISPQPGALQSFSPVNLKLKQQERPYVPAHPKTSAINSSDFTSVLSTRLSFEASKPQSVAEVPLAFTVPTQSRTIYNRTSASTYKGNASDIHSPSRIARTRALEYSDHSEDMIVDDPYQVLPFAYSPQVHTPQDSGFFDSQFDFSSSVPVKLASSTNYEPSIAGVHNLGSTMNLDSSFYDDRFLGGDPFEAAMILVSLRNGGWEWDYS